MNLHTEGLIQAGIAVGIDSEDRPPLPFYKVPNSEGRDAGLARASLSCKPDNESHA